jgi:hypothetical protein
VERGFRVLFYSDAPLLAHVGQHEGDVGGEQVVHLVPQRGLAQQLGPSDEVADGHVEVGVARGPVRYPGEGVGHQDLLQRRENGETQFDHD